jgi:hypothetical protein
MIRDEMVRSLIREFVGPEPGLPFMQLNGEEVLAPEDPPRLRYGAGILFPSKLPLEVQEDNDNASQDSDSDENGEDTGSATGSAEASGEVDERADDRGDSQVETDLEINRANEFLPSALGVTALITLPEKLRIKITAAQYFKVEIAGEGYTNSEGKWVSTPFWFRHPLDQEVIIDCVSFLDNERHIVEQDLAVRNDNTRLALQIFSRVAAPSARDAISTDRFITFTLINRTLGSDKPQDEECFFQCGVEVCGANEEECFVDYPDQAPSADLNGEELALELLYRHRRVFAVGHGCATDWVEGSEGRAISIKSDALPTYEVHPILPASISGLELLMRDLIDGNSDVSISACTSLAVGYEHWIDQQREETVDPDLVPIHLKSAADQNLDDCELCLRRMRSGIELLQVDPIARKAFALMNRAMLMQHMHYSLSTEKKRHWIKSNKRLELEAPYVSPNYAISERRWRPFQLAFVLMALRSIAFGSDEDLNDREIVDLIWFPTGGGKTEAYLGLAAFTIFYRRLKRPDNAGTTALMRYTLRLLTTQQYQRASSLICACEIIRRETPGILGCEPITIGLWVGGSVTPNSEASASHALNRILAGDRENPFIILSCPWCGAQMGPVRDGRMTRAKGYRKLTGPNRVRLICEDPDCEFNSGEGLPLQIIDEHIYASPPTLIIGTVDKFALLPWYPQARSLFGIDADTIDPPDLIIQDELHLISGPLGSMVGHYETVIDILSRRNIGDRTISAKIVASTATISRASEQINALYGERCSSLFPPQGLRAGNSFFAEERPELSGRTYAGVFASGLPSQTTTEVRTLSSLLQSPKTIPNKSIEDLDQYWTLMVYFNSIRELGHAATLLRADIPEYLSVLWRRLGFQPMWGDEAASKRRFVNVDLELTSRVQSSDITGYMERLFASPGKSKSNPVDVCLATNMIQVGLDVPRLSVMAIVGQPKTTSEYIQASSRVGRSEDGPGLVVTLLSPAKPRDRSHYEHFRSFHQSIYRYVEPTSVTPFAVPVTERALHALIITLARYLGSDKQREQPDAPDVTLEQEIRDFVMQRVMSVERQEAGRVKNRLDEIFSEWRRLPPDTYGGFNSSEDLVPFMYPGGTHAHEAWDDRAYPTPSSMRNVDASCNAMVIGVYSDE